MTKTETEKRLEALAADVLETWRPDHAGKVEIATILCEKGHANQKRKFSDEPYANHPKRVAAMAKQAYYSEGRAEDGRLAELVALCHDLLEDSSISAETLKTSLGQDVAEPVAHLTKPCGKERFPPEPRKPRKTHEFHRLATVPPLAQSVKLCDVIDNLRSFEQAASANRKWAETYLTEKENLAALLADALPPLKTQAAEAIEKAKKSLGQKALPRKKNKHGLQETDGIH